MGSSVHPFGTLGIAVGENRAMYQVNYSCHGALDVPKQAISALEAKGRTKECKERQCVACKSGVCVFTIIYLLGE